MKILSVLVASLLLVVGVSACSDDDDADSSSVELPEEAQQALDTYTAATAVDHSGNAMLEAVTDEFTFISVVGEKDGTAYAIEVDGYREDCSVEDLGDQVVIGAESTYIVSRPQSVSGGGFSSEGFSVIRIVESDGTWLVDQHRFTGTE